MNLNNLVKTIVHHLLISGMTCLNRRDEFPMVSALMYVMHIGHDLRWIMTQDYQLSWVTKLLYCMESQPWKDIVNQNQQKALIYGWYPKVVIYPYGLGHCWWRLVATSILNRGTMISQGIEIVCPLRWSKGHVIMKYAAIVIPLVEFDILSLELEYVNWSHNKWDL